MKRFLPILMVGILLAGITGCGQGEPDRYKAKATERPSKSVPPADPKDKSDAKNTNPAKSDAADKSKEAKTSK